jgi:hypothetical protein
MGAGCRLMLLKLQGLMRTLRAGARLRAAGAARDGAGDGVHG